MKKQLLITLLFVFSFSIAGAQVVINEFETSGMDRIELKNLGSTTVDVSSYVLCSFPLYSTISSITVVSGSTMLAPGAFVVLTGHALDAVDDEIGLYINSNFTDPSAIRDYVEWGFSGHQRSSVAQSAGIWSSGDFVAAPPANVSMEYDGTGDGSVDWFIQQAPTFGAENGIITSIGETVNESVSMFPSIVRDYIKIDLSSTTIKFKSIEVISTNGQTVIKQSIGNDKQVEMNLSELKSGNYMVRMNGEKTIVEKIIKE